MICSEPAIRGTASEIEIGAPWIVLRLSGIFNAHDSRETPKMNVESLMATCPAIRAVVLTAALGRMESLGAGAVSVDDHDTALQAEQKLLISNVSNEALEKRPLAA